MDQCRDVMGPDGKRDRDQQTFDLGDQTENQSDPNEWLADPEGHQEHEGQSE